MSPEEAKRQLLEDYVKSDSNGGLIIKVPGGVYAGYKVLDEALEGELRRSSVAPTAGRPNWIPPMSGLDV